MYPFLYWEITHQFARIWLLNFVHPVFINPTNSVFIVKLEFRRQIHLNFVRQSSSISPPPHTFRSLKNQMCLSVGVQRACYGHHHKKTIKKSNMLWKLIKISILFLVCCNMEDFGSCCHLELRSWWKNGTFRLVRNKSNNSVSLMKDKQILLYHKEGAAIIFDLRLLGCLFQNNLK